MFSYITSVQNYLLSHLTGLSELTEDSSYPTLSKVLVQTNLFHIETGGWSGTNKEMCGEGFSQSRTHLIGPKFILPCKQE